MRIFTFITTFLLISVLTNARQKAGFIQPIPNKAFTIQKQNGNLLSASLTLPQLVFGTHKTPEETFLTLSAEGFSRSYKPGEPDLPVYTQLIVVPSYVNLSLKVNSSTNELIKLSSIQAGLYIKPAQASIAKSQNNPDKAPLLKGKAYQTNSFREVPAVDLHEVGIMRGVKIYELVYQPVLYNAITNEIKVRKQSSIELYWNESFPGSSTWDFTNLDVRSLSAKNLKNNELRETYVIVSTLKYKETLQPFVQWKQQQGFCVLEAYIGEAIASADKIAIKNYLNGLYTNPAPAIAAPSYLLIVGDITDIPAWSGISSPIVNYVTDLYYAEYTNDFLPEIYFGRFSVNTTQQLQSIIDKTLYVEKGTGNQRGYQNDHLLISGVDANYAPVYGNGAVNYFLDYYSLPEFGINAHAYLYGSGSSIPSNSSAAKQSILNDFDAGVGIAYYTAHCSVNGWTNPEFSVNDIGTLNNANKYPVMIGNCCQSFKFNLNSFGEEVVRATGKGAVAYIGATDDSYWDEDYFWGVGFTANIVSNPTYESTGLGSWDAWFHTHNETPDKKAYSVGQILYAGNMAVQSSNSDLKNYYWEIYGIMGDPSLVPAKYQLSVIEPQFNKVLTIGQTILDVNATEGSMVTLWDNGELIAYGKTDETHTVNLTFKPLLHIGSKVVEICVSHPDFAPYIDTLAVNGSEKPYLVMKKVTTNDSVGGNNNELIEYGENIDYYFEIVNYGAQDAQNIAVSIASQNEWIEPLNTNSLAIPGIKAGESFITDLPFQVQFKNNVPNQELVSFTGILSYNDSLFSDFSFTDTVNAPYVKETNCLADQAGIGNGNGLIDENEDVQLTVFFSNLGHSQVSGTVVSFTSSNNNLLMVNPDSFQMGGFNPNETKSVNILAKGGISFFQGAQVFLKYNMVAGNSGQYLFNDSIRIILGKTPDILMHNGTEEVITGNFYDSGGSNGNYSINETYTLTLTPHNEGEGILVTFNEFDLEPSSPGSCWDKLSIYNGATTGAPLLGIYCNNNFENYFQSQNTSGSLTFTFESDKTFVKNGWKAYISSSPQSNVTLKIIDGINPVAGATVEFVNTMLVSDEKGEAIFNNTLNWSTKKYTISKTGYYTIAGNIDGLFKDAVITILLKKLPEVCFTVFESVHPLADVQITFNNDTVFTDAEGKAAFSNVLPGTKYFKASKIGFTDTIGAVVVGATTNNYTLKMQHKPGYWVNFIITDANGTVGDAAITIGSITKLTTADGKTSFDGFNQGSYSYTIEKDGYSIYTGTLSVIDSDVELHIEISLVGIGQNQKTELRIYPNPVSIGKSIVITSNTLVDQLVIYNYIGSTFVTINKPDTEYIIDISGFSPGIYILQAKVGNKQIVKKLIVE